MKKNQDELNIIMDNFKKALMRRVEDRAKEQEEFAKIESEQKAVVQNNFMSDKKEQCMKTLGPDLFEKMYQYMKKSKASKVDFQTMQKGILTLVNKDKDKMNMAFLIDQLIESEVTSSKQK